MFMSHDIFAEDTINYPIPVLLRESANHWHHVPATFSYDKKDPLAITTAFGVDSGETVSWTWARDLLREGISEPTGEADVIVYPGELDNAVGYVAIHLTSPVSESTFYVPEKQVTDFVDKTTMIVPVGQETEHLDIDATIAQILGST